MEGISEIISEGSHIQEKSVEKIALDYTYSLGQIDGLRLAIQTLKEIEEIVGDD